MSARVWSALLIVCVAIGCGKSGKDDILPQAKMEKVLWDVVQADEFIQAYVLKDSNKVNVNAERHKLYQQVFSLHKTNKDQFRKSYQYYLSHPEKNRVLFDSLAAKANRRMQDAYKGSGTTAPVH
jgi:hypothetical protein